MEWTTPDKRDLDYFVTVGGKIILKTKERKFTVTEAAADYSVYARAPCEYTIIGKRNRVIGEGDRTESVQVCGWFPKRMRGFRAPKIVKKHFSFHWDQVLPDIVYIEKVFIKNGEKKVVIH